MAALVLRQRPGRLQQAQHCIEPVAAGVRHQFIMLGMAELEPQSTALQQRRRPHFKRVQQVLARDQALRGLLGLVVALVAARAQHRARQQARIGLERDPVCIAHAQPRQRHASLEQQRNAGVQHIGHRRIDPFHARARTGRSVGGAVGKLAPDGTGGTEGREALADLGPAQGSIVAHASQPVGRPAQCLDQLARQAERQVEATDPVPRLGQAVTEAGQRLEALQPLEQHPAGAQATTSQQHRLAPTRRAAEIAAPEFGLCRVQGQIRRGQ